MTVSAKRSEWDKENMRTVSCRLRKEEAEKFRKYAEYLGTTPHALLSEYVKKCLEFESTITPVMYSEAEKVRNENAVLRRKLTVAEKAVDQARNRALSAEKLVDAWLRSADE